jgi:perosamine synthetase
MKRSLTYEF